ncbi:hypothetical protein LSUE1_G007025 [Lachnellula suecica]|uniref:Uncharacterized protein n=1 Tax=Lachnellula suecica TaxID=602035 RepID=A0A8T9C3U9_9HELO|nr:hypothetical protein LSUE1_G007025 [Lachnellula suecica]
MPKVELLNCSKETSMNRSTILRRVLLAPPTLRSSLIPFPRSFQTASPLQYATSPGVTSGSFWASLVPKPLRGSSPTSAIKKKAKSKEWNPATFFIIIFLFIGSMSIQMIALRNEFAAFTRRADAKIGLLKEIIERVKNGEEVDVEGLLGTGDSQREKEWEEVLKEIEEEDAAWEESQKQKSLKKDKSTSTSTSQTTNMTEKTEEPSKPTKSNAPVGFY